MARKNKKISRNKRRLLNDLRNKMESVAAVIFDSPSTPAAAAPGTWEDMSLRVKSGVVETGGLVTWKFIDGPKTTSPATAGGTSIVTDRLKPLKTSGYQHYVTPQDFFNCVNEVFEFQLDAAATSNSRKLSSYFGPDHDVEMLQDALALQATWADAYFRDTDETRRPIAIWLNPPYDQVSGFMERVHAEAYGDSTIVCLVPARTDTRWWHDHVMARADEVYLVRGRLKFERDDDVPHLYNDVPKEPVAASAPFPSALVVYRPMADHIVGKSPTFGVIAKNQGMWRFMTPPLAA